MRNYLLQNVSFQTQGLFFITFSEALGWLQPVRMKHKTCLAFSQKPNHIKYPTYRYIYIYLFNYGSG